MAHRSRAVDIPHTRQKSTLQPTAEQDTRPRRHHSHMGDLPHTSALWSGVGAGESAESRTRASEAVACAQSLRTIHTNVLELPSKLEYRRLRATGGAFERRVGRCTGGLAVLRAAGFEQLELAGASWWTLREVRISTDVETISLPSRDLPGACT